MNLNIPDELSPNSRVWVFQSNRAFREHEELDINEQLFNFYTQWKSHGDDVKSWAKVFYHQFIVVIADETNCSVGGCSTDGMTRVIKSFERKYGIDLFDRLTITFLIKDKVEQLPMNQVKYALENGFIETDSLLFNNLVDNKEKLQTEWLVPLSKSWLWSRIAN